MREAIEHVCAHAGTGARVRSLPVRPAAAAMRRDRPPRPHPVRPVPLADVRAVDVVRHRPRPHRAGLAAAVLQRRDARRELRLVRRQPHATGADRAASASPHRRTPTSRLLSLLKRTRRTLTELMRTTGRRRGRVGLSSWRCSPTCRPCCRRRDGCRPTPSCTSTSTPDGSSATRSGRSMPASSPGGCRTR